MLKNACFAFMRFCGKIAGRDEIDDSYKRQGDSASMKMYALSPCQLRLIQIMFKYRQAMVSSISDTIFRFDPAAIHLSLHY